MRAAVILDALAADYLVHLLVIPLSAGTAAVDAGAIAARWPVRVAVHASLTLDPLYELIARLKDPEERLAPRLAYPKAELCRFATSASIDEATRAFGTTAFDEVHVFRAYMAPFADPYLRASPERRPRCRLDLDDHECVTRGRLADLHDRNGDRAAAALERSESRKYAALEARYLPLFDRVYVCSERDRLEVGGQHGCRHLAVIPNAVRIPCAQVTPRSEGPPTLLFVGNLGYYPNDDAVRFLCGEILPELRARVPAPVRVLVVGAHPSPALARLCAEQGATLARAVPDVAPYYDQATLVVVPLRAGGGTRIKLLEAFAYRRPVVSTTLGAEGIDAHHEQHLLVADTPADFARQCARLIETPALGRALTEHAFALVTSRHTVEAVRERLRLDHRHEEA